MVAMNSDWLTRLINLYARHSGLSPRTVSTYAAGSGDFCDRLERGHTVTVRRASRITQWLSDNWPESADWPADIPRPASRTPNDKAA